MSVKNYSKKYGRKQAVVITSDDERYFTIDNEHRLVTYKRYCDILGRDYYTTARCCENDTFDPTRGKQIAKARWVAKMKQMALQNLRNDIKWEMLRLEEAQNELKQLCAYRDCLQMRYDKLNEFINASFD